MEVYLDEWIIITLHVAGFLHPAIFSITVLTNQVWKLLIVLFKVTNTGALTSAVYTGIKKPKSFSHSGFSLKVARQLPLNTPKNLNRKTHLRSVIFWNSAKISLVFCQFYVNARSNLAGIIRVFGHVVRDLQRNHPTAARDVMRTTRVRSKVERSRACTPLTKTQVWYSGLFVLKTPNVMGFSGSVNGTTKNPGFLDFGFCQCKWAYSKYYM